MLVPARFGKIFVLELLRLAFYERFVCGEGCTSIDGGPEGLFDTWCSTFVESKSDSAF